MWPLGLEQESPRRGCWEQRDKKRRIRASEGWRGLREKPKRAKELGEQGEER